MKNQKEIASKVYAVFAVLCLVGVAILVKIFFIQWVNAASWEAKAEDFVFVKEITPTRGQILASDGSLLATSVPEYDIFWDSQSDAINQELFNEKLDSMCLAFSNLLKNKTKAEYKQLFLNAKSQKQRYKPIARNVDFNQHKAILDFPFIKKGRFRSGFIFERTDKRLKPFGNLAARTIGIDRESSRVGLEGAFHHELSGKPGQRLEQRIPGGFSKPVNDEYIVEPEEGSDLLTSIDVHIQDVASEALERQMAYHHAKWGTVVVMEVETGYVRAISNLEYDEEKDSFEEVLNYAVGTATEPGSTFKLPAIMAAMDDGLANLKDTVDTYSGKTTFYGQPMHDSGYEKGEGNGVISVQEAFEISSNIGAAKTIYKAYHHNPQRFLDKLQAMGLGDSLGLRIKGEVSPKIRTQVGEKGWSGVTPTQMAIGYEITQTPLQILAFYNAVANDGKMMRPLFATHLMRNGKVIKEYKPEVIKSQICNRRTIEAAQIMLNGVVERGTGKDAFSNTPYTVSGKTGTARVTRNGAYVASKYRASFCGYFPSENPRYSCIVVIAEPTSGIYYASSVAAPVFKEIADKIYAVEFDLHEKSEAPAMAEDYHMPVSKDGSTHELITVYDKLNIPVNHNIQTDWSHVSTGKDSVEVKSKEFNPGLVPNVLGMGLQDAIYILENSGLQVRVVGRGTVKKQSVAGGSRLSSHNSITIELS